MSKRRVKKESLENIQRVTENGNVLGTMDIVMADAVADSIKADERIEEVSEELEAAAQIVKPEAPVEPESPVENEFTAKLVLDESLSDFAIVEKATDGRAHKIYDNDEDDFLDYDMFDFIYGLVTDCYPKPLNPLNRRIRKFQYTGSDDYASDSNKGIPQVASYGDMIELYADDTAAFNDIIEICNLYKFGYEGPKAKTNKLNRWNYSFKIVVPTESNGYPMMPEDYFASIGMTLSDVMPSNWVEKYNKAVAKIEKEQRTMADEAEVAKRVDAALKKAALDNEPLKKHLDALFAELEAAGLPHKKAAIRNQFKYYFDDAAE